MTAEGNCQPEADHGEERHQQAIKQATDRNALGAVNAVLIGGGRAAELGPHRAVLGAHPQLVAGLVEGRVAAWSSGGRWTSTMDKDGEQVRQAMG